MVCVTNHASSVMPRLHNGSPDMTMPEQHHSTFAWRDSLVDTVAIDPIQPAHAR